LIYLFYGRKHFKGEYALLHLIKRVASNILTEHLLETELREIIIDRDNIHLDKFDKLVKVSEFFDIERKDNLDDFFDFMSENLAFHTPLEKAKIMKTIKERQEEASMAVSPFVAIPHIILDEIDDFVLMLVRSKAGIYFSENEPAVKAVFVFAGSKEDREFHLKTLASIATLVQEPEFENKWMNAKDSEYLRDMILLSKRKRFHGDFIMSPAK
jgi:mannitol/fructose-specific phosphotransferase system IIA component (Ntr-type)